MNERKQLNFRVNKYSIENSVYLNNNLKKRNNKLDMKINDVKKRYTSTNTPNESRNVLEETSKEKLPGLKIFNVRTPNYLSVNTEKSYPFASNNERREGIKTPSKEIPPFQIMKRKDFENSLNTSKAPYVGNSNKTTSRLIQKRENSGKKSYLRIPDPIPFNPNSNIPSIIKPNSSFKLSVNYPTRNKSKEQKPKKDPLISLDYSRMDPVTSIGFRSSAGKVCGESKLNQDAIFINSFMIESALIVGIFDGHGLNGHRVSAYIGLNLEGSR